MPSLWKKQKGNRISRLVADIQTGSKRGGSLVVETGFPTSLIDLFVKNRDKLKKHKSKKIKSKKKTQTAVVLQDGQQDLTVLPSVSGSSVSLSESEAPTCSIDDNSQEFNDLLFVKETGDVDSCKNGEMGGFFEVSRSNNAVMLSILMGLLSVIFVVVLYYERWFLALITLGFVLLLLLDYVGKNSVFWFLKPCENVVSMSILKGALVVGVALYTKWFVVGITIGASLLLLLEYVGNSRFCMPCRDVKRKLQGYLQHWCLSNQSRIEERSGMKGGRRVLTRSLHIGSRKEICKEGRNDGFSSRDFDQGGGENGDISRMEIEQELGNNFVSNRENELAIISDGEASSLKGEFRQGSVDCTLVNGDSLLVEEETQNKPMYEILDLELNYSKGLRNSKSCGNVRYIDLAGEKGREKRGEDSESCELLLDNKAKKHKKFWKKLVPKKMRKKKKDKQETENNAACTDGSQDTETDLEEEISEGSTTMSSVEEDECRIDNFEAARTCLTEMFQLDNRTSKPSEIVKERNGKLMYLTTLMIPLTGLIAGRMFAVGLTVICCLVFKIVRA